MKNLDNLYLYRVGNDYKPFHPNNETVEFNVKENEDIELFLLIFNNGINVKVNLTEKGSSCQIKCVYLTSESICSHIVFDVVHSAPETQSNQLIKGILIDESKMTFDGIIRMAKDSQRCVGLQNHRAILLSEKAQVQATPELEIYADDVQCSHGSAVGPLEKEHLFYLMSRGIDEKIAQKILLESFVIDMIPDDYQNVVRDWLDTHI